VVATYSPGGLVCPFGAACAIFVVVPPNSRWLPLVILLLTLLHHNSWMWGSDRIVFGFPVNLVYHGLLCLLMPAVVAAVVLRLWTVWLDRE